MVPVIPHTPGLLLLSVVWGVLVERFEKHPVTPHWFSINTELLLSLGEKQSPSAHNMCTFYGYVLSVRMSGEMGDR